MKPLVLYFAAVLLLAAAISHAGNKELVMKAQTLGQSRALQTLLLLTGRTLEG